jgi:Zn-dependent M28 family amino/carboxypeptidase
LPFPVNTAFHHILTAGYTLFINFIANNKPRNMHKLLCMAVLVTALPVLAQHNKNAEKFANLVSPDALKKHLAYIAGPETEGRGTGTPGIEKAAQYIETQFRKAGLTPGNNGSYRLFYPLYQDSLLFSQVTVGNEEFQSSRHFNGDLRQGKNHKLTAGEIVFAGYGIDDAAYSDYKGLNVKDKVVIVFEGEPKLNDTANLITGTSRRSEWGFNQNLKIRAANKNGAKALLLIINNFPRFNADRKPVRGPLYPAFTVGSINTHTYRVSDTLAMAVFGAEKFKELKTAAAKGAALSPQTITTPISLQFEKTQFENKACNVVGILPGTDLKDEYVIITAHMDHLGKRDSVIYYGADDDGSGTCAIIQLATAFGAAHKAGFGARRTLVFMTVSGEEMGLWGSDYYVRNPLYPLQKTSVNLNIDMIGRISTEYGKDKPDSLNYVYIIGDDKISSDLRPLSEQANNTYTKLTLDYKYNDPKDPNRFYYRSDHYNFAKEGVPIIFYFNGVHKDYHRPGDTPDKINYDLYARRAQLVFHTGWMMANFERMLKRDTPLNMPPR